MLLIIVEIRGNELGCESERERERDVLSVYCVGINWMMFLLVMVVIFYREIEVRLG